MLAVGQKVGTLPMLFRNAELERFEAHANL
jgi:hypothetical protein